MNQRTPASGPEPVPSAPSRPVGWQPLLSSRSVDLPRMQSVAFTPMAPALRNELITEAYGDLAVAMAECLDSTDATWCIFGQWASHAIGGYLGANSLAPGRLIARAFGHGNRQVFADISRAHVTFLDTIGRAKRYGGDLDAAWERCVEGLSRSLVPIPGSPLAVGSTIVEVQQLVSTNQAGAPRSARQSGPDRDVLIRAFQAYRTAAGSTNPVEKSESILLGNALLGVHEQRLLDDTIAVGFRSWLRHLLTFWTPLKSRYEWRNAAPRRWQLSVEHWWIHFATRWIIGIALPDRFVRVGRPDPPNPHAVSVESKALGETHRGCSISQVPDGDLLSGVWHEFGVDASAARCWSGLEERVAFILAFMANEQRTPGLWSGGALRRPPARRSVRFRLKRLEDRIKAPPPRVEIARRPLIADEVLDGLRFAPSHTFETSVDEEALSVQPIRSVHSLAFGAAPWKAVDDDFGLRLTRACELLDEQTVRASRELFGRWTTVMYLGLLVRSLPDGYAAAHGVKVLAAISDLATNPVRRVGETAQFLRDLFERDESWSPEGMVIGGPAYESVRGVRLIHAIVARQLLIGGWDTESHGVPINQEDLLGTMLSFVVPPFEMMGELGIGIARPERDAYTRFWCAIGHLLGLPLALVTRQTGHGLRSLSYDEAAALAETIRSRQQQRSLDGVRMGEALLEGVSDGFPRALDWVAGGLFHAVGSARARELLLLVEGPGRLRARLLARATKGLLSFPPTRRPTRGIIQLAGRFWLRPFLDEGATRPFRRSRPSEKRPAIGRANLDRAVWPTGCRRATG